MNGDKPIIRMTDKGAMGYGTPWRGKEGLGENTQCHLDSLCFIERGTTNRISSVSVNDAALSLFPQVYLPTNAEGAEATLFLIDRFLDKVDFWRLQCNMEDEAATVAYNAMAAEGEKIT